MTATIGRYQIVDQIGAGAMGVVFRAQDPHLGRAVAIKVLADHTAAKAAKLRGTVRLRFEVEPDGHVRSVSIDSDGFPGTGVARCAARAAIGWEFAPGTDAVIKVPLVLGLPQPR